MDVWIEHPLKMLTTIKSLRKVCQQGSVDSTAPTILPPRVRVPSMPPTLLLFIVKFVLYMSGEKNENKQKEAEFGPFLMKSFFEASFCNLAF